MPAGSSPRMRTRCISTSRRPAQSTEPRCARRCASCRGSRGSASVVACLRSMACTTRCGTSRSAGRRSRSVRPSSLAQAMLVAVPRADAGNRARHPPTETARCRSRPAVARRRAAPVRRAWLRPRGARGASQPVGQGPGSSVASGIVARLSGPDGLTATHNSFVRRHALAENAGPALRQVIRQHNPAERDALAALHNGNRRPLPRAQGRGHHDPRHRERRNRRRDRRPRPTPRPTATNTRRHNPPENQPTHSTHSPARCAEPKPNPSPSNSRNATNAASPTRPGVHLCHHHPPAKVKAPGLGRPRIGPCPARHATGTAIER